MSASRSIAGARQRRAGEPVPVSGRNNSTVSSQQLLSQQLQLQQKQIQQQLNTNTSAKFQNLNPASNASVSQTPSPSPLSTGLKQGPMQIGNGPGKLSVSDAFALVTLRLGKLETLVNKWQDDGLPVENKQIHSDTYTGVDIGLLQSIVSRIEIIEQSLLTPQTNEPLHNVTNYEELEVLEKKLTQHIDNKFESILKDMMEVKDTLIKVQSFSMETNQKLVNAIFQDNENEIMMMQMMRELGNEETEETEETHLENGEEENGIQEMDGENITVNLKEIIKNELKLSETEIS
jgi:hypothetical protein